MHHHAGVQRLESHGVVRGKGLALVAGRPVVGAPRRRRLESAATVISGIDQRGRRERTRRFTCGIGGTLSPIAELDPRTAAACGLDRAGSPSLKVVGRETASLSP